MTSRGVLYRSSVWAGRIGVILAVLVILQVGYGNWLSALLFPKPSVVLQTLGEWLNPASGELYGPLLETIRLFLVALVGGTLAGMLLAAIAAVSRPVGAVVEPVVAAVHSIPRITLVPLFVLWFGIGDVPLYVYATGTAFFPIFFNMVQGWRSSDRQMIGSLQILGGRRRDVFLQYMLPYGRPFLISGLVIAAPMTLVAVIISELILGTGIGGLMLNYQDRFDPNGVYAATFVVAVLGVVVSVLVDRWGGRSAVNSPTSGI